MPIKSYYSVFAEKNIFGTNRYSLHGLSKTRKFTRVSSGKKRISSCIARKKEEAIDERKSEGKRSAWSGAR